MERTHGELGARLADGLGGDDADRLAEADHETGGEVAAVALGADAALFLAGEDGADLELLVADLVEGGGNLLVDESVGLDYRGVADGILDGLTADASDNAGRERDDFLITLVDRADDDTVDGAAILGGDDHVLRRVNELAGQVAGVGCLERGVGKTLAGSVGGDEVLEHGETLTEIRENRSLDDLA